MVTVFILIHVWSYVLVKIRLYREDTMFNVYVCHSKRFDFLSELYAPLIQLRKPEVNIVLPHEVDYKPFESKSYIKTCDLVIAEISFPSEGRGIELGWADAFGVKIVCLMQEGSKVSDSLMMLTDDIIEYQDEKSLVNSIRPFLPPFF
jgi:hypothetical protein